MSDQDIYALMEQEEKLKKYTGEDEVVLSHDLLEILDARSQEEHEVSMQSGFPSLDRVIHSFLGGELIVISGPTKHGKTLLAQTFTRNFYEQGKSSLWFSYEVPTHQFLKQFGDQLPAFVVPKTLKENSFSWIIERTHEAKLKFGISSVFIDNTHNIVNLTTHQLSQVIGELLKAAKRMALQFNVAVFMLHHITKSKLDDNEALDSSLLRDSSLVAQTADTVMFVRRDSDQIINPNKSYLKVTENRRYGVMNHITTMVKIGNFLEESEYQHG
jgi:replicative DNA helicase